MSPSWALAVTACLVVGGTASAAPTVDPSKYDILNTIYGTYYGGPQSNSFWDSKLQSSDKYWSALSDPITVNAEVKFSSGNYVLGIQDPAATTFQAYGAVTGTSSWPGGTNPFNNSGVKTYQLNNDDDPGQGRFQVTGSNASNPPNQNGTISFSPSSDPWAWTVFSTNTAGFVANTKISTAHPGYTSWSQYYAATTPASERYTSATDSPDSMLAYRLSLMGETHYVYFWNVPGDGGNAYNDLVLDVTAVQNPEPASLALMGLGAVGLLGYRLRRRGATKPAELLS